jgi:hypothetical protein
VCTVEGVNILGLGRSNLVKVTVDQFCRMNLDRLKDHLQVRGFSSSLSRLSELKTSCGFFGLVVKLQFSSDSLQALVLIIFYDVDIKSGKFG